MDNKYESTVAQGLGSGAHGTVTKYRVKTQSLMKEFEQKYVQPERRYLADEKSKYESVEDQSDNTKINPRVQKEVYVAMKKIPLNKYGMTQEAVREILLMKKMNHMNVLQLYDSFLYSGQVHLVMELMKSDLEKLLQKPKVIFTPALIKRLMLMICQGVRECHRVNVLHRDLKPANLLISKSGILKLGDFGLSKQVIEPKMELSPKACTLWYRAPELLFGADRYSASSDMWSVGCIFAELMLREPIFTGSGSALSQICCISSVFGDFFPESAWKDLQFLPNYFQINQEEKNLLKNPLISEEKQFSEITSLKPLFPRAGSETLELLAAMLTLDPKKRITADEALKHPYFSSNPNPTPYHKLPSMLFVGED